MAKFVYFPKTSFEQLFTLDFFFWLSIKKTSNSIPDDD